MADDKRELTQALIAPIRLHAKDAISRVIDDTRTSYQLRTIECTRAVSPFTGRPLMLITIAIDTSDRELFVGRASDVVNGSRDGHNSDFIQGFVLGCLNVKGLLPPDVETQIALDVSERDGAQEPTTTRGVYKYRTRQELIQDGYLVAGTPADDLLVLYELDCFLTSGRTLCGPSYGLILETRAIVRNSGVRSVLDLFAGPGCISRVALQSGAEHSTLVDRSLPAQCLSANLGPYRSSTTVREMDVTALVLHEPVDLVVCDPFYETALTQLSEALPVLAGGYRIMIANLGPVSHPKWCDAVSALIALHVPMVREVAYGTERIGVFAHHRKE